EGLRAASIGELYGSASRFDREMVDPCSLGPNGEPPANPGNCSTLGVPAGYTQPNPQISVTTGGNPDLNPEKSDSYAAGLIWSPSFLADSAWADRVDFEITYYRHEVEGAIQAIDAQVQLNLCVESLDPVYCDGISRAPTGGINGFNNRLTNLGVIKTDGWDIDLVWVFPEGGWGQFGAAWRNTLVGEYKAVGAAGQPQPQGAGIEVADSAIPDWTSTFTVDWKHGAWNAAWGVRHISELRESCSGAGGFPVCSNPASDTNVLPSTTYHDVQLGYRFDWMDGRQLTFGVNNLFDEDPPICLSCSLNGYDASTYDIPGGRYYYLRAQLDFCSTPWHRASGRRSSPAPVSCLSAAGAAPVPGGGAGAGSPGGACDCE